MLRFKYGESAIFKPLEFETFKFPFGFNPVEFDGIRTQTGLNSFILTPKPWIEKTGAVGITSSAGRYGGTFAYRDIAFEFASWVFVEFSPLQRHDLDRPV